MARLSTPELDTGVDGGVAVIVDGPVLRLGPVTRGLFNCLRGARQQVVGIVRRAGRNQIEHHQGLRSSICGDQIYGNLASDDCDCEAFTHGTLGARTTSNSSTHHGS